MVKVTPKKLKMKVIDVAENEAVEEQPEEVNTYAQEITCIKGEIENIEPS